MYLTNRTKLCHQGLQGGIAAACLLGRAHKGYSLLHPALPYPTQSHLETNDIAPAPVVILGAPQLQEWSHSIAQALWCLPLHWAE